MMATMQEIGFKPDAILAQGNNYDQKLIEGNDLLADVPVYVGPGVVPLRERQGQPSDPAVPRPHGRLGKPGWSKRPAQLAVFSWSSWLLFAQAAKACGSDLTRDCVLQKAEAVSDFDGGGLHAPVDPDPTTPKSPQCIVVVRATPKGFVLDKDFTQPNTGIYNCDDKNRVKAPR